MKFNMIYSTIKGKAYVNRKSIWKALFIALILLCYYFSGGFTKTINKIRGKGIQKLSNKHLQSKTV